MISCHYKQPCNGCLSLCPGDITSVRVRRDLYWIDQQHGPLGRLVDYPAYSTSRWTRTLVMSQGHREGQGLKRLVTANHTPFNHSLMSLRGATVHSSLLCLGRHFSSHRCFRNMMTWSTWPEIERERVVLTPFYTMPYMLLS